MRVGVALMGLAALALAACSGSDAPVLDEPLAAEEEAVEVPSPTAAEATPLPVEPTIEATIVSAPVEASGSPANASSNTESPAGRVLVEGSITTPTWPWWRPPPAGRLTLKDLEARQAEGERLEDSWRRRLGLVPGHPYSDAFILLRTVAMYVVGPLFPDHFRVVGVDDCLKLRTDPHPDARVINCLPERTVVRQASAFDPRTDGRNTWEVDGTLWRLLANPLDEYRYSDSLIGWADDLYLEDDRDTLPTTPYHKSLIDPPPVVHLEVEGSLPAGYLRVTGVDECLDVRAGPSLDSQVLHCLPEGYIMRYRPVASAGSLDRDGVLWRFLADPIHLDGWWSRTIGWADTRYLERGESIHPGQELETIALDPIPHVDFPDDVALIYRVAPNISRNAEGIEPRIPLFRVYKRNGVVTREVLFSLDQPGPRVIPPPKSDKDEQYLEYSLRRQVDMVMTPDLSRIVVAICHWAACDRDQYGGYIYDADPPSPHVTDLYESTDGGVTWHYIDTIPGPWRLGAVSAGNAESEPWLLLYGYRPEKDGPFDVDHHTIAGMLYPDGERIEFNWTEAGESYYERSQALAEYYRQADKLWERVLGDRSDRRSLPGYKELEVNQNRNRVFFPELWLSDNEILGDQRYSVIEVFGGASLGLTYHTSNFETGTWPWPTIHNIETGELQPMALPPQALHFGDWPFLLALQIGPFLRVVGVGDGCLPITRAPSLEAEEVACVAERVLLQDQDEVVEANGVTWHKAKIPAGVVGWADARHLE